MTFSVSASAWVKLLESGGIPTGLVGEQERAVEINFIQFCRNDLRFGLSDVCNESFLELLYSSCCAVYAHEGCSLYDGTAAIRWEEANQYQYTPLILTIKTREGNTDGAARKNVDSIVKELCAIGQQRALVLVVLLDRECDFGQEKEMAVSEDSSSVEDGTNTGRKRPARTAQKSPTWQTKASASYKLPIEECCTAIVSRVISIPEDDSFGLTELVRSVTGSWNEAAVFAAHSFAGSMATNEITGCRNGGKGVEALLRKQKDSTGLRNDLEMLWNQRRPSATADSKTGGDDLTGDMHDS